MAHVIHNRKRLGDVSKYFSGIILKVLAAPTSQKLAADHRLQ